MRGRPDREDYFAIGAILAVLMLVWSAYTYQRCGAFFDQCTLDVFKDWQPLIAGSLAFVGAAATVFILNRQNRVAQGLASHARSRRAESYRASLSLVLSNLIEILQVDNKRLHENLNAGMESDHYVIPEFQWPVQFTEGIEVIRLSIEYEDEQSEARNKLKTLLAKLQIYGARRRPEKSMPVIPSAHSLRNRILDCIELYALTEDLFRFARPAGLREARIPQSRMLHAAQALGYWDEEEDGVMASIQRQYRTPD